MAFYDRGLQVVDPGIDHRKRASWRHNLLRALAVHSRYNDHQARQGDWRADIPFYQALNALAHMDTPAADRQTRRPIDHLSATHYVDGYWGVSQRQWCTFLAVHALRNVAMV